MDILRVRLLGPLELDGVEVSTLRSRKARSLLRLLALARGRPVPVDRLVECLWGDELPRHPQRDLSAHVSRVRSLVGAERVVRSDAGYALAVDWLDLAELDESGDFGIALGVAAMGSVGTSVYRDHVVLPAEVHAESAGVARDSIAGAVSVAGQGSGPFGAGLLDSAHEAFTAGMHAAAGLSAIVVVGLAILAVTAIRRRPASAVAHLDQCDQADPTQRPRAEPTRTRPVGKDLTGTTSEEAAMPGA